MSNENVIVSENVKQNAVGKLFQEEKEAVVVTWKIPNFTKKLSDPPGTHYESPTFVISDICGFLSIYPNGRMEQVKGYCGLFLNMKGEHSCTINCTLSIRNAKGVAVFYTNFEEKFDSLKLYKCFLSKNFFRTKSTLMYHKSELLPDDTLTIEGTFTLTIECTSKRNKSSLQVEKFSHSSLQILSSDFSKLLNDDLYQDVELQCEDRTLKAHKIVLSTRSKVFSAMLQSDMIEGRTAMIEVKDMKFDVCKELLYYIYSGKLPELTPEIARGLYEAADRYNVEGLMEPCAEFLTRYLTTDNACEMLVLADAHSDQGFKESVTEYILDEDIPLEDDTWKLFCQRQPLLAIEVLNRYCRSKKRKMN